MKKLILILMIFISGVVFADNSMIGVSLGYSFSGFREVTIADVNRYLNTIVFSIHSVVEKENFIHSHNVGFFSGQSDLLVKNPVYQFEQIDYYQVKDTYSRLFLEYALTRKLWGNNTFPGYLGGAMRGDLYLVETLDNPVYINLTAIASLNLYVNQKWIINDKNTLVLSLGFPFFGYAVRPHYIGFSAWPLETGITSLHNYWACFGSIKYYYRINNLISLYSDIGFDLSHIDFPETRRDVSLQIKLGAVFMY